MGDCIKGFRFTQGFRHPVAILFCSGMYSSPKDKVLLIVFNYRQVVACFSTSQSIHRTCQTLYYGEYRPGVHIIILYPPGRTTTMIAYTIDLNMVSIPYLVQNSGHTEPSSHYTRSVPVYGGDVMMGLSIYINTLIILCSGNNTIPPLSISRVHSYYARRYQVQSQADEWCPGVLTDILGIEDMFGQISRLAYSCQSLPR